MSSAIFPTLPGLDIGAKRSQFYSTLIQTGASGAEQRAAFMSLPRYRWDLTFNCLRKAGFSPNTTQDEVALLVQFFQARQGAWDSFLYTDPEGSTALLAPFGTGDTTTVAFQICDADGLPVYDLNGTPAVYKAGVLQTVTTHYTVSSTGLVTFVTAPGAAAALTWSGAFYRRVRFDQDSLDLEQLYVGAWATGIKLVSVRT